MVKDIFKLTALLILVLQLFSCADITPLIDALPLQKTVSEEQQTPKEQTAYKEETPAAVDTTDSSINPNYGKLSADISGYRNKGIEEKVRRIPASVTKTIFNQPENGIEDLINFLIADEPDPFMQVKLIHDWVADNIAYDTESFFSGNIPAQGWADTLKNHSSVCEGYSGLFKKMCDIAGIQCQKVTGHARGYGFALFGPEDFSDSNHAWNAVKIEGFWYLVDCTWDAGHLNGRTFAKHYSTSYLFLEPEYIIYTHFPVDPQWQLLDKPKKSEEVENLPKYRGSYFLAGLKPVSDLKKRNFVKDSYTFTMDVPDKVKLLANIAAENGEVIQNTCMIQQDGNMATVMVRFPEKGNWELRLFTGPDGKGNYESVTETGFTAESGSLSGFPVIYTSFVEGCYLFAPLENPLSPGKKVEFKLRLPGYKRVYVLVNDNRYDLVPGADGIFKGIISIPKASKLGVYGAKENNAKSYTGLVGYTVK